MRQVLGKIALDQPNGEQDDREQPHGKGRPPQTPPMRHSLSVR